MKKLLFLIVVFSFLLANTGFASTLPFKTGEKLDYDLSWANIAAGQMTMEVAEIIKIDDEDVFRLSSRTLSNKFVSTFYKIDEKVESYLDAKQLHSLGIYTVGIRKERERTTDILFDQEMHKAVYVRNGESSNHDINESTHDSLSSVYFLRTKEMVVGEEIQINTFENRKTYLITVKVLQKEKKTVPFGTFDTIKVKMTVSHNGVPKKRGGSIIWLTDDDKKIPVMFKTKIGVGHITAQLKKMKKGGNDVVR